MDRETQRLYWIWCDMRRRCSNPTHKQYHNYGGRGISVCARWTASFADFLADMGPRPSRKYSLDRTDNDKGYSPDNCRWATRQEQNLNKRTYKNNPTGERNIEFRDAKFRVRLRRGGEVVATGSFPSIEEAKKFRDSEVSKHARPTTN